MKRAARSLVTGALAFASASFASGVAHALATFTLVVADPAGVGFNDPTPATPVGGNTGTTVGEQRKIAFEHALLLWGRVLESPVPIVVSASFGPLGCNGGFAVLGHAGPTSAEYDVPGVDPTIIVPEALADQLAGMDLVPGEPDIEAEFNGGLAECIAGFDWYYGLDGMAPRNGADLVSSVIHEVGHGLGFLTLFNAETGEDLVPGYADPFSTHLLDLATDKHWHEMTPAERMTSGSAIRGLVWDGQYGTDAARTWFRPGSPHLETMPEVPGLTGVLIDGNFGRPLAAAPIVGGVAATTPANGCDPISGVTGAIAVAVGDACHPMDITYYAEQAGALAVLITSELVPPPNLDVPAEDLATGELSIPAVGISAADAELLLGASGVSVTLSANPTELTGADAEGRIVMYASSPRTTSSTASHFDPIARPDLILEPVDSPNPHHDITVERAVLRDIGWRTLCGNGAVDASEECDAGAANSDTTPDACRTTCRRATCGDGIVDTGEACDPGTRPSTDCAATCTRPVCGNGMREGAEECDSGGANSDTAPNACRTTCVNPSCGDAVVDGDEACDDALTPATCSDCSIVGTGGGGSGGIGGRGALGGTSGTSGTGGSAGGGDDDDDDEKGGGDDGGGCGCRVNGARPTPSGFASLLAALALLLTLRRREKSNSARAFRASDA